MNDQLDYRNIRRDPITNKLSHIDPNDHIQSTQYSAPKRAIGKGLTVEQKTWLWENWDYNSNISFSTIAKEFDIKFSDMTLKKVDLDMMKRYRKLGGNTVGLASYLNNKPLSSITHIGE